MNTKKMMVTLLHGTWARNAPWTQTGSPLRTCLEQAGYRVEVANWGAGISFAERSDGAFLLRRHLLEHPEYEHVVIAHSHGGNVALRAIDGDDTLIKGLICLNTPFLSVLGRNQQLLNNIGVIGLGSAGFMLYGVCLRDGFGWPLFYCLLGLLTVPAVLTLLGMFVRKWVLKRGQGFSCKPLGATPIYCLSTPDDEAYGALAFFASLQNFIFLALATPVIFNKIIGVIIGALIIFEELPFIYLPWDIFTGNYLYTRDFLESLSSSAVTGNPWQPLIAIGQGFLVYMVSAAYYYGFYAIASLIVLMVLSTIVTISQGLFAPISGLFYRFIVTLVPLTCSNTKVEEIVGDQTPLRHSSLYGDRVTINKIMQWVEQLAKQTTKVMPL